MNVAKSDFGGIRMMLENVQSEWRVGTCLMFSVRNEVVHCRAKYGISSTKAQVFSI